MTEPYEDIIHLPHHTSLSRPRMSTQDRAAQFAPFAALTGLGAAIDETARRTDERIELDEDNKSVVNERLCILKDRPDLHSEVSVTFFQADPAKSGGAYRIAAGCVKKIDMQARALEMQDSTIIRIEDILEIEGTMFD